MKSFIIFVVLIIHFAFSTKFLNASGFNESYSLRSGLSAVNEAGIIFNIMEQKHKGSTSELIATVWLLKKGYEVFRNVSDRVEIDIIAVDPKTNETILIDVTTMTIYKNIDGTITYGHGKNKHIRKILKGKNIKVLIADIETNKVYWSNDKIFNKQKACRNIYFIKKMNTIENNLKKIKQKEQNLLSKPI